MTTGSEEVPLLQRELSQLTCRRLARGEVFPWAVSGVLPCCRGCAAALR